MSDFEEEFDHTLVMCMLDLRESLDDLGFDNPDQIKLERVIVRDVILEAFKKYGLELDIKEFKDPNGVIGERTIIRYRDGLFYDLENTLRIVLMSWERSMKNGK